MKILNIISLCFVLLVISCNNNKAEVSTNKEIANQVTEKDMHKDSVRHFTAKMKEIEDRRFHIMEQYPEDESLTYMNDPRYHKYTKQDIVELLSLVAVDLKTNGYKFPDMKTFSDKIDHIYGLTDRIRSKYLKDYGEFYFVIFDTVPPFYPEPYKEQYIELHRNYPIEFEFGRANTLSNKYGFILYSNECFANYVPNEEYTFGTELQPYIIHRNKYLFNDSNASLTWLKNNDSSFLENLFDGGYTKDKDLDQWILNKRLKGLFNDNENLIKFVRTFVYLKPNKTLKFNKEIFEIITDNPTKDFMNSLLIYTEELGKFGELDVYPDLSFEQRAEIYARLIYLGEDVAAKHPETFYEQSYMSNFRVNIGRVDGRYENLYYEEFKKNNFYNLPKFKEYWDATNEQVWERINYIIEHGDQG